MTILLLIAAWLAQGIPLPPSETGIVTGTLKTETGAPAVGVRVGAMTKPEAGTDAAGGSALVSIAETDAAGRFRLESIPPGRYYITAGRVDFPTYFPGSQLMATGTAILVKSGDTVSGIDFVLNSIAVRPPDSQSAGVTPTVSMPIKMVVAGGGKIPIYSSQGFASLQMTRVSDGAVSVFPLADSISLPIPSTITAIPQFRIALQNLPENYRVSSILYGTTLVTSDNDLAKLLTAYRMLQGGSSSNSFGPPLTITLAVTPPSAAGAGVRVAGSAPNSEPRSVYLSGVPGIFFADGSFEFRNVKPGRYSIATPHNPMSSRPLAASIVVGNQDLDGVQLVATPLLPNGVQSPTPPYPADGHTPGFTIPQGVIQGQVLDETTHQPIPEGTVYLTGHYGSSRSLVHDGRFEFTRLLPGSYDLEVLAFGHSTVRRTVVIDETDVRIELDAPPIP